jgi:hypothetical protein
LGKEDEQDAQADQVRRMWAVSGLGAKDKKENMSQTLWIIEDFYNGTWRVDQPYRIYKSKESADKGLERIRTEFGTMIPRRVTDFRAVEGK